MVPPLRIFAAKCHRQGAKLIYQRKASYDKARKEALNIKTKGSMEALKTLRNKSSSPLVAITRHKTGPLGQPKGSVCTDPHEIDELVRDKYGKIYDGNVKDQDKLVRSYVDKYRKWTPTYPQPTVRPLTADDLASAVKTAKETAAGMDQWAPGDLKLWPRMALEKLAELLNEVEDNGKWPEQMRMAKASFLAKDEENNLDPLAYRVLLMLPTVYRLWARVRLAHLAPWIKTWAGPHTFAGVEGKGAPDAAYSTALQLEHDKLEGAPHVGGSADIYKCFDQIQRGMVNTILFMAGMPDGIRAAYMDFISNLEVRNTIAGNLGKAYTRLAGIPQGDPFSMMVVALLTETWIRQMLDLGVIPRILADDLLILVRGMKSLAMFVLAFDLTHAHLHDLGAKVSPSKCYTFAAEQASRNWLRRHKWRLLGTVVPVANDGRDLGFHYNALASRMTGNTLTQRMKATVVSAEKLKRLPVNTGVKAETIRAKLLPKALYGAELAPVSEAAMRSLRAKIADVLSPATVRRSVDLVFALAAGPKNVDPDIDVVVRRFAAARRAMVKSEEAAMTISRILEMYKFRDEPGMRCGEEELSTKELAGPPVSQQRSKVRRQCKPYGPIGLLLESAHMQAGSVNTDLHFVAYNETAIDIVNIPYQQLSWVVADRCKKNRSFSVAGNRKETQGLWEIDEEVTLVCDKVLGEEPLKALHSIRTGSAWTQKAAYLAGQVESPICKLCGVTAEDSDHFWYCDSMKGYGQERNAFVAGINPDVWPAPIRHGIAPALAADFRLCFWGVGPHREMPQCCRQLCGLEEHRATEENIKKWAERLDEMEPAKVLEQQSQITSRGSWGEYLAISRQTDKN